MPQPHPLPRADGGSARTQAGNLPDRAWRPRPMVARAIRASRSLFGLGLAAVAVRLAAAGVGRPAGLLLTVLWLGALAGLSVLVIAAADRLTRRLLPVAALYQLSLVFPDEAPSRFSHALRGGWRAPLTARSNPAAPPGPGTAGAPITLQGHAESLLALVQQLTVHDRRTRGHTERVRAYARLIGEEIGLAPDELDKLNWGALLHDIGKLDVPTELLNKPDRPTEAEWAVLRHHPEHAEQYVAPLRPWLGEWLDAATQHHERIDGDGYPNRLRGEQISLAARIVAIADAYDVMTSARSYKAALSPAVARAELTRAAGTQFDAALVRAFLQVSLGRLRWIVGPLGWLTQLPSVLQIPITTAVTAGGTALLAIAPVLPTVVDDVLRDPPAIALATTRTTEPLVATPATGEPELQAREPDGGEGGTEVRGATEGGGRSDATLPTTTSTAPAPTTTTTEPGSSPDGATDGAPSTTAPGAVSPPGTNPPGTGVPGANPPGTSPPPTAPPTTVPPTTTTTLPASGPAVDDAATARPGKSTVIQVTANDLFATYGQSLAEVTIRQPPAHGTATVVGQNVKYDTSIQHGTDTLVYEACSNSGWCGSATVTIEID